jgi:hypothetical protein
MILVKSRVEYSLNQHLELVNGEHKFIQTVSSRLTMSGAQLKRLITNDALDFVSPRTIRLNKMSGVSRNRAHGPGMSDCDLVVEMPVTGGDTVGWLGDTGTKWLSFGQYQDLQSRAQSDASRRLRTNHGERWESSSSEREWMVGKL